MNVAAGKIILVHEDATTRERVRLTLAGRFEVLVVADARAASDVVGTDLPDLVLASATLDGYAALVRALRAGADTASIPIVALCEGGAPARRAALEAGADDCLAAPFEARELLARITPQIALLHARREPAGTQRVATALQMSEEWLRLATRVGKVGVWDWDVVTDRIVWTEALYAIHGVDPRTFRADLEGFSSLVHPDDRDFVAAAIRLTLDSDAPYEIEFRAVRPDGEIIWLFTSAVVLREGGRPVRLLGATMDITDRKRAAAAVEESEARFHQLADTIPQLAWIARPDGHIFWYNRRWYEYTGTTPEDMQQRGWESVHDPHALPTVLARWQMSVATGQPFDMILPLRRLDGVFRWFLTRMMPLTDETGEVRLWFGTNTDVTDQKVLEEQQRLLMSLTDATRSLGSAADVMWEVVQAVGRHFRVARCTYGEIDPTQQYVTVTRDYFAGVRSVAGTHHLDDFGPDAIREMKTGRSLVISDVLLDPRTNGPTAAAAFHGVDIRSIVCVPLVKDGRFEALFTVQHPEPRAWSAHDVVLVEQVAERTWLAVENVRAEEAKRRQNERVRLLSEAAGHLLTAADPDAMVRGLFERVREHLEVDAYFNFVVDDPGDGLRLASCAGITDAEAHGIGRLEFGQAICGTAALQRREIVMTHIQQSADPKAELAKSLGLRAYACNPLMVGARVLGTLSFASRSRDRFDADELEFIRTLCHYVSAAYERMRLIEQLRAADRHKDEFLATLAHELRNPLAPIRNAVEILRLTPDNPGAAGHARTIMERQLQQMVRLIDDLLDLSRISRGKVELRPERVELTSVLQHALETSRPLIQQSGHQLTISAPSEAILVDADVTRLAQVFANLLNNAAKYTNKGGRIWVTVERHGTEVSVAVRDDGVGIPPHMLPVVFEMFTQVDRRLDRHAGGLGIGLSIVKRLVEMHGGTVEARSAGQGRGSEFTVRLPVRDAAVVPRALTAEVPAANGDLRRRVLVADDNADAAASLAVMLEILGNEVRTANDGREAVEIAAAFRPDIVVLDIGMPELNGYDACRQIRDQPWSDGTVFVALTGLGQEEDRQRSREAGFDHHLVKPVEPAMLAAVLAIER